MANQIRFSQIVGGINNSVDPEFIGNNQAEELVNFDVDSGYLSKRKGMFLQSSGTTAANSEIVYTQNGMSMLIGSDETGNWTQLNIDYFGLLSIINKDWPTYQTSFNAKGAFYRGRYYMLKRGGDNAIFRIETDGISSQFMYGGYLFNAFGNDLVNFFTDVAPGAAFYNSDAIGFLGEPNVSIYSDSTSSFKVANAIGNGISRDDTMISESATTMLYDRSYVLENYIVVANGSNLYTYLTGTTAALTLQSTTDVGRKAGTGTIATNWAQEVGFHIAGDAAVSFKQFNGTIFSSGITPNLVPSSGTVTSWDALPYLTDLSGSLVLQSTGTLSPISYVILSSSAGVDSTIQFFTNTATIVSSLTVDLLTLLPSTNYVPMSVQFMPISDTSQTMLVHIFGKNPDDRTMFTAIYDVVNKKLLHVNTDIGMPYVTTPGITYSHSKSNSFKPWFNIAYLFSPKWCLKKIAYVPYLGAINIMRKAFLAYRSDDPKITGRVSPAKSVSTEILTGDGTSGDIVFTDLDFSEDQVEYIDAYGQTITAVGSHGGTGPSGKYYSGTIASSSGISNMYVKSVTAISGNLPNNAPFGINYNCIASHLERLFIGGKGRDRLLLYYTDANSEYIDAENYLYIPETVAGDIVGMISYRGSLLVWTTNSIWRLGGYDINTWTLSPIDSGVGLGNEKTVIATEAGVIFVNDNGIYLTDGNMSSRISDPILKYVNQASWLKVSAEGIAGRYRNNYMLYGEITGDGNKQLLIFDFRQNSYRIYSLPENFNTFNVTPDADWRSMFYFVSTASIAKMKYIETVIDEEKEHYFSSTISADVKAEYVANQWGDYYTGASGLEASPAIPNSATVAIHCTYKGPQTNLGQPELMKRVESIDIYVKDTEATFTATLATYTNKLGIMSSVESGKSFTLEGSNEKKFINFRPTVSHGMSFQLTIENNDMYEFNIYEIIFNYTVDKKISN